MSRDFDKYDQTIDSRDVVSKMEELESELEEAKMRLAELQETPDASDAYENEVKAIQGEIEDIEHDLAPIKAFNDEGESTFGDAWQDGVYLISDDYFDEYAEDFAKEIGAISNDFQWPINCIDWVEAANELKQDYSDIEFDGREFWGRE